MEKQIRPEPDFYAKQYMILSCKMENAIMLIENGAIGESKRIAEICSYTGRGGH